jgi:hypothetical protein
VIDVDMAINAVRREVGGRVLAAGEASVVTLSRSYPAEIADVWDACTNPERIARWFLPVSGELRVGGRYQLKGNAGGTITHCDPPHGFDATWEMGDEVSWIELRLAAEGNGQTSTGQVVDPARVTQWAMSEDGRRFLTGASEAWREASVAFGTDPARARAAADRTTAFYTGAPEPGAGNS